MTQETISYTLGGKTFTGYAAYQKDIPGKRPAVIVAHAWKGLDDFAKGKAEILSRLGYVGFAADLYGIPAPVTTNEEAQKLMMPLFTNRHELQQRIKAAYDTISKHPLVDPTRIGAIGFCFGGLTVIELLRSGTPIQGAVSFHGVLGNKIDDVAAHTVPIARNIRGALLMLHGQDDPLVSLDDIVNMQKDLTDAQVDWQMNIYSHTSHAFTNPDANDPALGLHYQPRSERRAWIAMRAFLTEIFARNDAA